ncbi:hypothetical protein A0U89_16060 (plasmid) [Kozakia baliensis]|uniref:Uncharacterized protein n=1 Tax=Kozakia baliensis TaxID=153496 RepID=A0A1D8UYM9_9PROT|nr:hypothetical protein A0U89_16060 [Kozakia baliensis]
MIPCVRYTIILSKPAVWEGAIFYPVMLIRTICLPMGPATQKMTDHAREGGYLFSLRDLMLWYFHVRGEVL